MEGTDRKKALISIEVFGASRERGRQISNVSKRGGLRGGALWKLHVKEEI